jgi:hypothetical protein
MSNTTLYYTNGDRFVGQVSTTVDGIVLPHGIGTLTKPNGDTYTGSFFEGRRHGQGQSYSVSTQRHYSGGFSCDREEGYATITRSGTFGGQRQYLGYIVNGQRHGRGQLWESSLSGQTTMFEGEWANDLLNGLGRYTVVQYGVTYCYEGNFVNGRLEGWGTYWNSTYNIISNAFYQSGNMVSWS